MARTAVTLIIALVGAIYYAIAGEDPEVAACINQVDKVAATYRSHPPKTDSRKAIENTLKHARAWCGDRKFKEADAGIEMAAFLCVASKGCKPLIDQARRFKQSAR